MEGREGVNDPFGGTWICVKVMSEGEIFQIK